ncbi:MAG TPA: sugar phosphate nucleotidyltransferase [Coriobacteriia bacterium]|nr:sugar phosphate nucleotidyltransferase [Coriobacteriia bacterium]
MTDRIKNAIVTPNISVIEALETLNHGTGGILFVASAGEILLGVLTDGDIRRHILAGRQLSDPVSMAMNDEPVVVRKGFSEEHVREIFLDRQLEAIPVLDDDGRLIDAIRWNDVFGKPRGFHTTIDVPVAIMAGGKGTRLQPFTRILPKPLMPVGDIPILQLIMDRFHEQGVSDFLVSLNHKSSLIRAYFSDVRLDYGLRFYDEDKPLGTAGSLKLMARDIDGTFILANCDTIIDTEYSCAIDYHRSHNNAITIIASMQSVVLPYGVCDVGEGGMLENLREKPRFDMLVSTGVYVMESDVLDLIKDDTFTDATDLIEMTKAAGRNVGVYPIAERSWLDIGQIEELQDTLDRLGIR